MQIVIWGTGERGKRIYSRMQSNEVVAFIDNDANKIGTEYEGKRIISLAQYIENYSQYFILISPLKTEEIRQQLERFGISQYFDLSKSPAELQSRDGYTFLDKFVNEIKCDTRCAIYGTEFYSIYLFARLMQRGNQEVYLIPEAGTGTDKLDMLSRAFPFLKILTTNRYDFIDRIYITTGDKRAVTALRDAAETEAEILDIFDMSNVIEEYWNKELEKFKDAHIGERCFIVATGPSLRMEDLDVLKKNNVKSIGMNKLFLAYKRSAWRPDYYVVDDSYCLSENSDELKNMPVGSIFLSDTYPEIWEKNVPPNVYKYHSQPSIMYDEEVPFSEDIVKGIYSRGTVTYSCIQLAAYMGFQEIILLGVDFSISNDYRNKDNHFDPDYYNDKSKVRVFWEKDSLQAYESAQKHAEEHGIKIYNATRGGKLEVFERVEFDSLFA